MPSKSNKSFHTYVLFPSDTKSLFALSIMYVFTQPLYYEYVR